MLGLERGIGESLLPADLSPQKNRPQYCISIQGFIAYNLP